MSRLPWGRATSRAAGRCLQHRSAIQSIPCRHRLQLLQFLFTFWFAARGGGDALRVDPLPPPRPPRPPIQAGLTSFISR